MNEELELYKLITSDGSGVSEFGWSGDEFLVWVYYFSLDDFIVALTQLCSRGIFDDGGFKGNFQEDGVCIDLCEAIVCSIDIESVFPKEQYQH